MTPCRTPGPRGKDFAAAPIVAQIYSKYFEAREYFTVLVRRERSPVSLHLTCRHWPLPLRTAVQDLARLAVIEFPDVGLGSDEAIRKGLGVVLKRSPEV